MLPLALLNLAGVSASDFAASFTRPKVAAMLRANVAAVAVAMERDEETPPALAAEGLTDAEKRIIIRSALFRLIRATLPGLGIRKGAGLIADYIRDQHDDQVVALVAPQINAQTAIGQVLALVGTVFLDRVF